MQERMFLRVRVTVDLATHGVPIAFISALSCNGSTSADTLINMSLSIATKIHTVQVRELEANAVLVKNVFAGINASDINFTAGLYLPGMYLMIYVNELL
jgi:hypothetical protein